MSHVRLPTLEFDTCDVQLDDVDSKSCSDRTDYSKADGGCVFARESCPEGDLCVVSGRTTTCVSPFDIVVFLPTRWYDVLL